MAIESNPLSLGRKAIDFSLLDTCSGEYLSLKTLQSDIATVIMFVCNHCPYVVHIQPQLVHIINTYQAQGIAFIAISANDINTHPEDGPEHMKAFAQKHGFTHPYLYDETQEVARAYDAACTPDFFVFDQTMHLAYHGQFDDASPGNQIPVSGKALASALDCLLNDQPITDPQRPSIGCSIKWKK